MDDQGAKETNFNLEGGKMPNSKSQSDFQYEILQSQTPIDEEKKFEFPDKIRPSGSQMINLSITTSVTSAPATSTTSSTSSPLINIPLLQTQFLSNYVHFLHNYQLFNSIQAGFNEPSLETPKCLCFKEMLTSFLVILDHQFNEKFINGSGLWIDECLKSNMSITPFLGINELHDTDERFNSDWTGSVNSTNVDNNQFIFSLIIRCCNSLVTLFEWVSGKNGQVDPLRMKFFETFRDDYRLKNFYCLFQLAELNYDELLAKAKHLNDAEKNNLNSSSMSEPSHTYHLLPSLNSLRSLFKNHVDDYFSLD